MRLEGFLFGLRQRLFPSTRLICGLCVRASAGLWKWVLLSVLSAPLVALADLNGAPSTGTLPEQHPPGFEEIYDLLKTHCGACHVRGGADGPWSLDTPPDADRFPFCLQPAAAALRCATYHQLTDAPGPDIPAWVRPEEAAASDPYVQACVPGSSFHIGHALPEGIPAADCTRLLRWIETGAHY